MNHPPSLQQLFPSPSAVPTDLIQLIQIKISSMVLVIFPCCLQLHFVVQIKVLVVGVSSSTYNCQLHAGSSSAPRRLLISSLFLVRSSLAVAPRHPQLLIVCNPTSSSKSASCCWQKLLVADPCRWSQLLVRGPNCWRQLLQLLVVRNCSSSSESELIVDGIRSAPLKSPLCRSNQTRPHLVASSQKRQSSGISVAERMCQRAGVS